MVNYTLRKNNMDDSKDLDALLSQLKFDFDDNLLNSTATTITTAASTWPYPNSSSGSYTWATNSAGGYNLGNISPSLNFNDNWQHDTKLKVQGDAEFEGDVKIKGKSINEMFEKIEERLAILHPNEKLEEKWEELRELRNRYVELEKEIIEKEKMWNILKK
jgi:hypothetical protein